MSQADAISEAAKAVAENEAHTNVEVEAIEAAATPLTDEEVQEIIGDGAGADDGIESEQSEPVADEENETDAVEAEAGA